jgi:hypothetical protein
MRSGEKQSLPRSSTATARTSDASGRMCSSKTAIIKMLILLPEQQEYEKASRKRLAFRLLTKSQNDFLFWDFVILSA